MNEYILHHGSCLDVLPKIETNSIDSIVTDPPYELGFMGKSWDASGIAYNIDVWKECLRVLKPGGHLLAFSGSRTYHRMTCAIEDAGFEVRDQIMWVYGSGFPKSLDVSKSIESKLTTGSAQKNGFHKLDGKRQGDGKVGMYASVAEHGFRSHNPEQLGAFELDAKTDAAKQWQGWGTALKPAHEPVCVARKPLIGTVADNVLKHGTGAINVDGCRVGFGNETDSRVGTDFVSRGGDASNNANDNQVPNNKYVQMYKDEGRWPANLIHDGSDEVLAAFPQTTSGKMKQRIEGGEFNVYGKQYPRDVETIGDAGSAARFFYCAKASKADRDAGLDGFSLAKTNDGCKIDADNAYQRGATLRANTHPTVKPTDLMRYLCRLVTPPNGTVLDPFMGSGSTGKAAMLEGFNFVGIDLTEEYIEIAKARISHALTDAKKSSVQGELPL